MENKGKIKFFSKPPKGKMAALALVFLWIALWNVIYQVLHGAGLLHFHIGSLELEVVNWAFFSVVTLFFMQEELTYKERFLHTLVGGTVGCLLAAGIGFAVTLLMKNGVGYAAAVSIPLVTVIAMLILLNPYMPVVFNNVGFIALIFSFVESDKVVSSLPSYILSIFLGSVILNLGCTVLINQYTKIATKKAIAKMKAAEAAKAK